MWSDSPFRMYVVRLSLSYICIQAIVSTEPDPSSPVFKGAMDKLIGILSFTITERSMFELFSQIENYQIKHLEPNLNKFELRRRTTHCRFKFEPSI